MTQRRDANGLYLDGEDLILDSLERIEALLVRLAVALEPKADRPTLVEQEMARLGVNAEQLAALRGMR